MNQSATRTLISKWDNAELWDLWSCFQNSIIWRNNNNNNGRWHQNNVCSSFLFFSCWLQDADFVSFTPVKWVNVQCFKTSPDACWVQNKMRISWTEGHYCHLHFALPVILPTEQLAISSLCLFFSSANRTSFDFCTEKTYCWESYFTGARQTRISF